MKIDFKKIYNSKIAIIAGVILFALIVPNFAHAFITAASIGAAIIRAITSAILNFFGIFVGLAAKFFDAMLDIGFASHKVVAELGWKIVRDFSNMFFILIMVVIAFATILRLERYGIKELLPKVIIIALLINFSLVICYIIIDFSDITAHYFIDEAKKVGPIASTLVDALNITRVWIPPECSNGYSDALQKCNAITNPTDKDECLEKAADDLSECSKAMEQIKNSTAGANIGNMITSMILGSIVLMVAAFTLFAGGILLIVRLLFLWFLVMLAPIVYLCYLMPGLRSNWQKWWKSFINWCLFAPIYTFFLWLAIKIATEQRMGVMMNKVQGGSQAQLMTTDFFSKTDYTISFLFIIAILLGGLIAARQLGIYGADTALKIGQKWAGGAKQWAKQTAMRPAKYAATQAGGAVTAWTGRTLGGKFGRRLEAKGYQMKMKAAEERQHKQYAAMLGTMSDKNVEKEIQTAIGVRKMIATREAKKRGILREADRETVGKAAEAYQAFGNAEEARGLEELRPDAIKDETKRKAAIERAIKEGTHKKWSKEVFKGLEGNEIVGQLQEQLGTNEFANVFKGWAKDIKDAAEEAMKTGFTSDFTTPTPGKKNENIERRKTFAKATGKASEAFAEDKTGEATRDYFESLSDEGFGNLRTDEDKKLAAKYMTEKQVEGAGLKFTGKDKRLVMDEVKKLAATDAERRKVLEQMERSLGWGGGAPAKVVGGAPANVVDLKEPKEPKTEQQTWEENVHKQAQKKEQETEEQQKKKKTGSITDESITD
jgi:hypothetical protein